MNDTDARALLRLAALVSVVGLAVLAGCVSAPSPEHDALAADGDLEPKNVSLNISEMSDVNVSFSGNETQDAVRDGHIWVSGGYPSPQKETINLTGEAGNWTHTPENVTYCRGAGA